MMLVKTAAIIGNVIIALIFLIHPLLCQPAINCTHEDDCSELIIGYECDYGQCSCRHGYSYHSSSQTCKALYGSLCEADVQCDDSVRQLCSSQSHVCICKASYLHEDGLCKSDYGGSCVSDLECSRFTYCHTSAADYKCRCDSDHIYQDATCKAKYNGECVTADDCAYRGTVCLSGRCLCTSGYEYDPFKQACLGLLGTTCQHNSSCGVTHSYCSTTSMSGSATCICIPGFMQKSGACKALLGSVCASDFDCYDSELTYCDTKDSFKCVCDGDSYKYEAGSCLPLNGRSCSLVSTCYDVNSQCSSPSQVCKCKNGFILDANQQCKALIGEICSVDSECYAEQSRCTDKTCLCIEGYSVAKNNDCLANLQAPCTTRSDCLDSAAECNRGVCTCPSTHSVDPVTKFCKTQPGGACINDSECITYSTCANKICTCNTGYTAHSSGLCQGGLGRLCKLDQHCSEQNSLCYGGVCFCKVGFVSQENKCKVKLGFPCTGGGDCIGTNSICIDGFCSCASGYEVSSYSESTSCLASFGRPCSAGSLCSSGVCNRDLRCGCAVGQKFSDIFLSCKSLHGKICKMSSDCYDAAANCSESKCQCSMGYEFSSILQRCEDIDECASSPCLNNGVCQDMLGDYFCSCPDLYAGKRCDISTDYCKTTLCLNGGHCINHPTTFYCECPRGFSGNLCQLSSPTELRDIVSLCIIVKPNTEVSVENFQNIIAQGLAASLDLAYCRHHNLRLECKPLAKRRRRALNSRQLDVNGWSVEVDRIQMESTSSEDSALVYFSARHKSRLQDPSIIISLLSLLLPMELAIKLSYLTCGAPSLVSDNQFSQHLCWIRSVFKLPAYTFYPGAANSLSLASSLSLAMQTALRRRENLISQELSYPSSISNLTARAVIIDTTPDFNNHTLEVLYYGIKSGYCLSAIKLSSYLNNFTMQEFSQLTLLPTLIIAEAYNTTDKNTYEEYNDAFVIVTRMPITRDIEDLSSWSSLEKKITEMLVFLLDTNTLPPVSSKPTSGRRRRSYTVDLITAKLLKVERIDSSSEVHLVTYAEKQNKAIDPEALTLLLKSADINMLSLLLGEVIDGKTIAFVYRSSTSHPGGSLGNSTGNGGSSCLLSLNTHSDTLRYWVKTVTKVPLDISVNSSQFKQSVEERLSLFLMSSLQRYDQSDRGIYQDLKTLQPSSQPTTVCAKVVSISRMNSSSSHTEIVYLAIKNGEPVRAITVVDLLNSYDVQELAVALSQVIHIKAQVYGQSSMRTVSEVSSGSEFLVVFMENYVEGSTWTSNISLTVTITTCTNRPVRISVQTPKADIYPKSNFIIQPTKALTINLPSELMLKGMEITYKSLKISSEAPVVVTALNRDYLSSDGYLAQPVSRLGQIYQIASYWPSSLGAQLAVTAAEDNTELYIQLSKSVQDVQIVLRGKVHDFSSSLKLRQYEVLQIQSYSDLTGTMITSNKPVAVYSGNVCTNIRGKSRDHLITQLLPSNEFGQSYILLPYTNQQARGSYIQIIASADDTSVYLPTLEKDFYLNKSGDFINLINSMQTTDFRPNEAQLLFSNKPIQVIMYSYSGSSGESLSWGDPSLSVISPISSYQSRYRFTLLTNITFIHSIQMAIEHPEFEGLRLNGQPLPNVISWLPVPGTAPMIVSTVLALRPGTYSLHHINPFITFYLHVYATALHESYSFEAGSCKELYEPVVSSTQTPWSISTTSSYGSPKPQTDNPFLTIPEIGLSKENTRTSPSSTTTTTTSSTSPTSTTPSTSTAPSTTTTPSTTTKSTLGSTKTTEIKSTTEANRTGPKDSPTTTPTTTSSTETPSTSTTSQTTTTLKSTSTTTQHPTLPRNESSKPFWLAMTVGSDLQLDPYKEFHLERLLLELYTAALQMGKRSIYIYDRTKRFYSLRSYSLQIVKCIEIDDKHCDLVFYITLNHVEINPVSVENTYSRLTTNYIASYLKGVSVHSHIRAYLIPTTASKPTIATTTTDEGIGGDLLEAAESGSKAAGGNNSVAVAGWVVGGLAITTLLMASACFATKKFVNNEGPTWIQKRLSNATEGKNDKKQGGGGDRLSSRQSETDTRSDTASVSRSLTDAEGDKRRSKKTSTPSESEEEEGDEELKPLEEHKPTQGDVGALPFKTIAMIDNAKNKEKLRKRMRLRKHRLARRFVDRKETEKDNSKDESKYDSRQDVLLKELDGREETIDLGIAKVHKTVTFQ